LIADGTCVAIDESTAGVVDVAEDDVELLPLVLLLLPHPASATMTSKGAATARIDFLI
jgi:hypothetical protein